MRETIQEILRKKGLVISIYFILGAIIFISIVSILFRNQIVDNSEKKETVLAANHGLEFMNKYVNLADLGLRGYMIIQEDGFLTPYTEAIQNYQSNLDELRVALSDLGYDVSQMNQAERAIQEYMTLVQEMVNRCEAGDLEGVTAIFRSDPGYNAWKVYSVFESDALAFIEEVSGRTNDNYNNTTWRMIVLQIVFLFIGAPVLIWTISSHRKTQKQRTDLFDHLYESNKSYIFNPGEEEAENQDESLIIDQLINNLKRTTDFVSNISKGNYDVKWEGLNDKNFKLNTDNIAGELINMRDQMKKVKAEDEKRIWISQGLSDFAAIIRNNQNDFKSLSEELISNIVKYLNVRMGGMFILNSDMEDNVYLELAGCYAYNRLKTVEKKILPGKGLVGQCYLEGETIYLKDVPQEFVNITSGLGDARPNCVLLVPLKLNDKIEGVIELASLKVFEDHEVEFVEKLGETLASAITTVKTTEKTNMLLEQTQQQAEEMRAQEEEMRQNMEELQATQEQMHRKNEEVEELLRKASLREEEMKKQNESIQHEKTELETGTAILDTLMELLPERITIKDDQGKFLKLSESKYKTLREQGYKNIIGKSDKDIFGEEHFEKSFAVEKALMKSGKPVLNVEEKINISKDVSIWGLTSRVPFINSIGKTLGTIVVTRDITREKNCEEELEKIKANS